MPSRVIRLSALLHSMNTSTQLSSLDAVSKIIVEHQSDLRTCDPLTSDVANIAKFCARTFTHMSPRASADFKHWPVLLNLFERYSDHANLEQASARDMCDVMDCCRRLIKPTGLVAFEVPLEQLYNKCVPQTINKLQITSQLLSAASHLHRHTHPVPSDGRCALPTLEWTEVLKRTKAVPLVEDILDRVDDSTLDISGVTSFMMAMSGCSFSSEKWKKKLSNSPIVGKWDAKKTASLTFAAGRLGFLDLGQLPLSITGQELRKIPVGLVAKYMLGCAMLRYEATFDEDLLFYFICRKNPPLHISLLIDLVYGFSASRNVPAPEKGVLTLARAAKAHPDPLSHLSEAHHCRLALLLTGSSRADLRDKSLENNWHFVEELQSFLADRVGSLNRTVVI